MPLSSGGTNLSIWHQAYRYMDHGPDKQRCAEARKPAAGFPPGIVLFADTFLSLQEQRIEADYNPLETFVEADAQALFTSAENAIAAFDAEP